VRRKEACLQVTEGRGRSVKAYRYNHTIRKAAGSTESTSIEGRIPEGRDIKVHICI